MIILRQEEFAFGKPPSERTIPELLDAGVIILDKPRGPSSHEVSAFVRKILEVKKTGHTGTLDQDVSGVLIVLLGHATKAVRFFAGERKSYVCVMSLGTAISKEKADKIFENLRGKIYQTPPLASAVAKRLRVREVYSLRVLESHDKLILFDCDVAGGTYVRKLVSDFGALAATTAEMRELRRTSAVGLSEGSAVKLQDISDYYWLWKNRGDESFLRSSVKPIEDVIALKRVIVSDDVLKPITTGAHLFIPGICSLDEGINRDEFVQIMSGKGELICFAQALLSSDEIKERRNGAACDVMRVVKSA